MPGTTGRISTLTKAKISALLDRLENPAEAIDYAYERQLEDLQTLKGAIAELVTAKKQVQSRATELTDRSESLGREAAGALSAGNEALARAALERKQTIATELESLDQQVSELEAEQERLTAAEKRLRAKVQALRSNKEVIKAQYSAAEAQVRFSEAAAGVGDDVADLGQAMERVLDKTETMKARANAIEQLEAGGAFNALTPLAAPVDDPDAKLEQLQAQSAVDDELAKLKAELQSEDAPPRSGNAPQQPGGPDGSE
jgi:phage shock protein A